MYITVIIEEKQTNNGTTLYNKIDPLFYRYKSDNTVI